MNRWLVLLFALSCKGEPTFVVPESDTDTDTDTDSDTDTDADADSDADTDAPANVDCTDGAYPTPDPGADGLACLTQDIQCGDTVNGTNVGGSTHYGTASGEQFEQCSGGLGGSDLAGPERVYRLVTPPGTNSVFVSMQSCEPSEMMYHRSGDSCPVGLLSQCGYLTIGNDLDQEEGILLGPSGVLHFVVEGKANNGGNYTFTVECYE